MEENMGGVGVSKLWYITLSIVSMLWKWEWTGCPEQTRLHGCYSQWCISILGLSGQSGPKRTWTVRALGCKAWWTTSNPDVPYLSPVKQWIVIYLIALPKVSFEITGMRCNVFWLLLLVLAICVFKESCQRGASNIQEFLCCLTLKFCSSTRQARY